jgi:CAAX protease family protein
LTQVSIRWLPIASLGLLPRRAVTVGVLWVLGFYSVAAVNAFGVVFVSLANDGAEGGVLPSSAYVLTRRLWLPIGIHFGWDFSQDALFGIGTGLPRYH